MRKISTHNIYKFISVSLVFVIIILGLIVIRYDAHNKAHQENNRQVNNLLYNFEEGIQGQACGIFSQSEAEAIIGAEATKDDMKSRQGFNRIDNNNKTVDWSDSCVYQDKTDSNKYVELYINTYQTQTEASDRMKDFIPLVNSAELVDLDSSADDSIYDAGVYYVWKDRKVIRLAVSNGVPSQSQEIGLKIINAILKQI